MRFRRPSRVSRSLLLVSAVLTLLALSSATAFAAGAAEPLGRPPWIAGRDGTPLVRSAAYTVKYAELPVGNRIFGYIDTNTIRVYHVPLRAGQTAVLNLYGGKGTDFGVELWLNDPDATDPVASVDYAGYPQYLSYTVPSGMSRWYDIVVYSYSGSGTFRLDYSLGPSSHTAGPVARVAGANRVETAIRVTQSAFTTASTVVLATGWEFADALAASGLCGSYDAPLLLTHPTSLSPGVLDEIRSLGATEVIIVGSKLAVSDGVKSALAADGLIVRRIGGAGRFDTARMIAAEISAHETSHGRPAPTEAFVVWGRGYADALACSPYAANRRMPVLLAETHQLPGATLSAIADLGIDTAYVVGGPLVVDGNVYSQLPVATKRRIWGGTGTGRYATTVAMANFATATKGWATWSYTGLATGVNYPDALGGGVVAGKRGGVILLAHPKTLRFLANGVTRDTYDALYAHHNGISQIALYGSELAISNCTLRDADVAAFEQAGNGISWEESLLY